MVIKLERYSHLSDRSFGLGSRIGIEYLRKKKKIQNIINTYLCRSILKHGFLDQYRCEENVVLVTSEQFPIPPQAIKYVKKKIYTKDNQH